MEVAGPAVASVEWPAKIQRIARSVTAISQKELTRNLRELTEAGLLARDSEARAVARYKLTNLGEGLMPTFQSLLTWGEHLLVSK